MAGSGNDVDTKQQWNRQYAVAVGLIVAFVVLVVVMLFWIKGDEVEWQRRIYLFSVAQALVFTAVGWLFGREVSRSALVSAREETQLARDDAAVARTAAEQATAESTKSKVTAAEERAKGAAVVAAAESVIPAGRRTGPSDVSAGSSNRGDVEVDLKAFIERLYNR